MADHVTPKDIEENVRQITEDSSWKSALPSRHADFLAEPKDLKAEALGRRAPRH